MVNRGGEKVRVHMNVVPRSTKNTNGETEIFSALRSAQPAAQPTTSTGLDETPALIGRQTKYSTLMTPRQRKAEAVKSKLDNELVDLSLDS